MYLDIGDFNDFSGVSRFNNVQDFVPSLIHPGQDNTGQNKYGYGQLVILFLYSPILLHTYTERKKY